MVCYQFFICYLYTAVACDSHLTHSFFVLYSIEFSLEADSGNSSCDEAQTEPSSPVLQSNNDEDTLCFQQVQQKAAKKTTSTRPPA